MYRFNIVTFEDPEPVPGQQSENLTLKPKKDGFEDFNGEIQFVSWGVNMGFGGKGLSPNDTVDLAADMLSK